LKTISTGSPILPLYLAIGGIIMPINKNKKGLPRKKPVPESEKDLPDAGNQWLNTEKSGDPSDHSGVPSQLKGLSQMDAIAWVHANCKFASSV